jgi:hypothetical protein
MLNPEYILTNLVEIRESGIIKTWKIRVKLEKRNLNL